MVTIQRRYPEGHALDRRGSSETPGIWLGFVDSTERYRGAAQSVGSGSEVFTRCRQGI